MTPIPAKTQSWPHHLAPAALLLALWLPQAGAQSVAPGGNEQPDWNDNFRPANLESLVEQGQLALSQSRLSDAEQSFSQALQVSRALNGLQNPGQFAVLDQLLEALLLGQRWREFDRQLDYLEWLNVRINSGHPDKLAEGLIRQSDWHRAAAAAIQDAQSPWYLVQAKYLNWQAVTVLEEAYGQQDLRLVPLLYRIAMDHYYQTVSIERRGITSFEFKSEEKVVANGWSFSKNETVSRSYRIGRDNLSRIQALILAQAEPDPVAVAMATIQQADWEYVFGNDDGALSLYQNAYYELLHAGLEAQQIDNYFSQLTILPVPEPRLEWSDPTNKDNESSVFFQTWSPVFPGAPAPSSLIRAARPGPGQDAVRAQLLIRLGGYGDQGNANPDLDYRVTGIEIVSLTPSDDELTARVFEEVPRLKFRPRIQAGEPVSHGPVSLSYVFSAE